MHLSPCEHVRQPVGVSALRGVWVDPLVCISLCQAVGRAGAADDGFLAGVARRVITPTKALWMAGYAARDKPAEGKLQDLYVKALALQDSAGTKLVLMTSDLVGL